MRDSLDINALSDGPGPGVGREMESSVQAC